jgi:dTDP-D-glucose 4,6-dehydratase
MERVKVIDAVRRVCELAGYEPEIVKQLEMPVGPMNRVADNSRAKALLDWEPGVSFADGLKRTFDWYFATKDADAVRGLLDFMLTGRGTPPVGAEKVGAGRGGA